MTDRITEAELKEIEAAIAQVIRDNSLAGWERADGEPVQSIIPFPLVAKRLVAEVRRLLALFTDIADPDPTIGPLCPRHGDRCPTPKAAPGQIASARSWPPSRIDAAWGSQAERGIDASCRDSSSRGMMVSGVSVPRCSSPGGALQGCDR